MGNGISKEEVEKILKEQYEKHSTELAAAQSDLQNQLKTLGTSHGEARSDWQKQLEAHVTARSDWQKQFEALKSVHEQQRSDWRDEVKSLREMQMAQAKNHERLLDMIYAAMTGSGLRLEGTASATGFSGGGRGVRALSNGASGEDWQQRQQPGYSGAAKVFACLDCDQTFESKDLLRQHSKQHVGGR